MIGHASRALTRRVRQSRYNFLRVYVAHPGLRAVGLAGARLAAVSIAFCLTRQPVSEGTAGHGDLRSA